MAAEARWRVGGLWQRHARLTVYAVSWLTVDSSQYSVLSLSQSLHSNHSLSVSDSLSLSTFSHIFFYFLFFIILFESASRVKSVNGLKKKKLGWAWGGRLGLGWGVGGGA